MSRCIEVGVLCASLAAACGSRGAPDASAPPTIETVYAIDDESEKPLALEIAPRRRVVAHMDGATCALRDGTLYCWGYDHVLRGDGQPIMRCPSAYVPTRRPAPFVIEGSGRIKSVVLSPSPTVRGCVLGEDGRVHCFGGAYYGLRRRIHCLPPGVGWLPVELPDPALEIAMLGGRVCARLVGGRVACWGEIYDVPEDRPPICDPTLITTEDGAPLTGIARIDVDVALDEQGTLYAWGHDEAAVISRARALEDRLPHSFVAHVVSDLPPLADVASTGHGTCALTQAGSVLCWGQLSLTRDLGRGPAEEYLTFHPTPIADLPRGRALACTVGACFLWGVDRRLYRWGEGEVAFETPQPRWVERGPIVELRGLGISTDGGCVEEPEALRCWASARLGLGALPDPGDVSMWTAELPAEAVVVPPPPRAPCPSATAP